MTTDDKRPEKRERRPFNTGKKAFKGGKRQFGDKKPYSGPRPDRGPRREEGDRARGRPFGERSFSDRGPRRDSGDRPRGRPFGDRERGPRREGDRPRPFGERSFSDRGPRRDGGDRPRGRPFGDRERPERKENGPYRGMYGRPKPEGEYPRGDRPYRKDPRPYRDNAAEEYPNGPKQEEASPGASERPHLGDDELRYLGKNACLGLWKARPQDVVRIYVLEEKAAEFKELIEYCAKNQKAYHLVGERDLEKLTDSVHHQGICMIARAKRFFKEEQFFAQLGAHRTLVMYLDGVANPHNLGAILRTAAHFGVKHVCVPKEEITRISPALYRTAEGGAEAVNLVRVEDTEKFLDRLTSQGFHLYAFEAGKGSQSLFETRLNEKSVFIFGAEVEGLSGLVRSIVGTKLAVPGTGAVESLNVSVAAAVAMAEFEKQGMQRTVRIVKNKP